MCLNGEDSRDRVRLETWGSCPGRRHVGKRAGRDETPTAARVGEVLMGIFTSECAGAGACLASENQRGAGGWGGSLCPGMLRGRGDASVT